MKNLTLLLTSLLILGSFNCFGQFKIRYSNKTGAIESISNPADKYKMDWIFSSSDSLPTWQKPDQDWGMGKYGVNNVEKMIRWDHPQIQSESGNKITLLYQTKYLNIQVSRKPVGKELMETYTFINKTTETINVHNLSIYTPFNENYPDAKICATNRCNAHIWSGMYSSYVNAVRMDGKGPNLGLVFTKGAMKGYAIENRGWEGKDAAYSASNTRGTILLDIAPYTLKPGGKYVVQWRLFWHKDFDDFLKKAKALGYVRLSADRYVISKDKNQKLQIEVEAGQKSGISKKEITVPADSLGEHSQKVYYDGGKKYTMLNYLVISSAETLIDKRVHFIVNHQQMNDKSDPRYGAYMVYDNQGDSIVTNVSHSVSPLDRNAGRERIGMGILIATWLQHHPDPKVHTSLLRYVYFVRHTLQSPDYHVYSNVAHTGNHRGYNYPWVADLYLQMYHLTGRAHYLNDFYYTLQKFYKEFGYKYYAVDIRVKGGITALRKAGQHAKADSLLHNFVLMGNDLVKNGIYYPKSEVNYEEGIVAPSVQFLCELYLVTHDIKYLKGAEVQLPSLIAFCGRQPDVHLNWIANRFWDDYWFGKAEMWGDTMPHYWSTLVATAFDRYYQCTKIKKYRELAKEIVHNNLLNFKEDGRASCAYLYPDSVDGKPAKFYDAYANDQDWALVFYLDVITPDN